MTPKTTHPEGEASLEDTIPSTEGCQLDTYDGKVAIEWDTNAQVTPLGQLPFFIEFIKLGGRFDTWVDDCPLYYKAKNAPQKVDVLGSLFLSILSGHYRYKHLAALRNDTVNSRLLGMAKIVSEDSARRALKRIDETEGIKWLQTHLLQSAEPLLTQSWILDCDVTVKPLYGHQEAAEKGYNPTKRGRPCQTFHTYLMANLRLVLDVEVQPGNQTASSYSLPGLIDLLHRLPVACRPTFVRGDCDWGTEPVMTQLEGMGIDYLFKLKQSNNVKKLIYKHHSEGRWERFSQQWEAKESEIQLNTWQHARRVVILRRLLPRDETILLESGSKESGQQCFGFIEGPEDMKAYQYAVLVSSLKVETIELVQHYRDRGDCENVFDEIKNHWGWGGFTTRDQKSCQLISRMIALIYNWWTLFIRLANPNGRHIEALSSRPQLLTSVGQLIHSSRQKLLRITDHHGRRAYWQQALIHLHDCFSRIKAAAQQHNATTRWHHLMRLLIEKLKPKLPEMIGIEHKPVS